MMWLVLALCAVNCAATAALVVVWWRWRKRTALPQAPPADLKRTAREDILAGFAPYQRNVGAVLGSGAELRRRGDGE